MWLQITFDYSSFETGSYRNQSNKSFIFFLNVRAKNIFRDNPTGSLLSVLFVAAMSNRRVLPSVLIIGLKMNPTGRVELY